MRACALMCGSGRPRTPRTGDIPTILPVFRHLCIGMVDALEGATAPPRPHFQGSTTMFVSGLALTLALSSAAAAPASTGNATPLADATLAISIAAPDATGPVGNGNTLKTPRWMLDAPIKRPAALPAMYASLGVLQALDIYSTRRAIDGGATELNPAMRSSAKNTGAMLAVKALSTAGSIYFTERAWKKNRKGAIVLMAVVNGVTAAVVANNMKNVR
jgi:hypothetical protein